MATLTIRHVPEAVVERLKAAAKRKGYSMEQEVRELLAMRYAARTEIMARTHSLHQPRLPRWHMLAPLPEALDQLANMAHKARTEVAGALALGAEGRRPGRRPTQRRQMRRRGQCCVRFCGRESAREGGRL